MRLIFLFCVGFFLACGESISNPQLQQQETAPLLVETFDNPKSVLLRDCLAVDSDCYSNDPKGHNVEWDGRGKVLHYHLPASRDEMTPVQFGLEGKNFRKVFGKDSIDEACFEWDELFKKGYDFPADQKLLRLTYWSEAEDGKETKGSELTVSIPGSSRQVTAALFHERAKVDLELKSKKGVFEVDKWFRLKLWIKLNTPGKSDGFIRIYVDGKEVLARTALNLRGEDKFGYNIFWLGGNATYRGRANKASDRYIDNLTIWPSLPVEKKR